MFEALTHASSAGSRERSYERLEFLGDSILGFAVCELLFQRFPDWQEGELTKVKSVLVSRQTCMRISLKLGLGDFLILGKGMASETTVPSSLLANVFESIVAAIYLDSGLQPAKKFILDHLEDEVSGAASGQTESNYKSQLQQYSQREFGYPPSYILLDEKGPDHNKSFLVCAKIRDHLFPSAWGTNKKEAERRAAGNAMAELDGTAVPFPVDE